jgi:hypothetical protein
MPGEYLGTLRKCVAAFIGGWSAPIYFGIISYLLVRPLTEDDTLAWIWAFAAPAVILIALILMMVCIGLGYLTYRLVLFELETIFAHRRDMPQPPANDHLR